MESFPIGLGAFLWRSQFRGNNDAEQSAILSPLLVTGLAGIERRSDGLLPTAHQPAKPSSFSFGHRSSVAESGRSLNDLGVTNAALAIMAQQP